MVLSIRSVAEALQEALEHVGWTRQELVDRYRAAIHPEYVAPNTVMSWIRGYYAVGKTKRATEPGVTPFRLLTRILNEEAVRQGKDPILPDLPFDLRPKSRSIDNNSYQGFPAFPRVNSLPIAA